MATKPCVPGDTLAEHKARIERRQRQAFRDRWHKHPSHHLVKNAVDIPQDIERVDIHEPCVRCNAAGPCRHRPWIGQGRVFA